MPKAPNKELLEHEKKRQMEAKVFTFTKKLRAEKPDLPESEVEKAAAEERLRLRSALENQVKTDLRNAHQAALAKQEQMAKLKGALKITQEQELGAAFDLELQERRRLERLAEKDRRRKEEKRAKKEAERKRAQEALMSQVKDLEAAKAAPKMEIDKAMGGEIQGPEKKEEKKSSSRRRSRSPSCSSQSKASRSLSSTNRKYESHRADKEQKRYQETREKSHKRRKHHRRRSSSSHSRRSQEDRHYRSRHSHDKRRRKRYDSSDSANSSESRH